MESKKIYKGIHIQTETESDTENKLSVTKGERGGQEQIRSIRLIDTTIQIIGKQQGFMV